MTRKAPGWGKAIGIIMICLGGLSVFYQLYKLIFSMFFKTFGSLVNEVNHIAPDGTPYQEENMRVFNNIFGLSSGYTTLFTLFSVLGLVVIVLYIIGGVKLLTPTPKNYNLARYALLAFLVFNAIQCLIFFTADVGFFMKMILIYSVIGFVFDLVLFIILSSSDKTQYGIGETVTDTSYDGNVSYLEQEEEEVF